MQDKKRFFHALSPLSAEVFFFFLRVDCDGSAMEELCVFDQRV